MLGTHLAHEQPAWHQKAWSPFKSCPSRVLEHQGSVQTANISRWAWAMPSTNHKARGQLLWHHLHTTFGSWSWFGLRKPKDHVPDMTRPCCNGRKSSISSAQNESQKPNTSIVLSSFLWRNWEIIKDIYDWFLSSTLDSLMQLIWHSRHSKKVKKAVTIMPPL